MKAQAGMDETHRQVWMDEEKYRDNRELSFVATCYGFADITRMFSQLWASRLPLAAHVDHCLDLRRIAARYFTDSTKGCTSHKDPSLGPRSGIRPHIPPAAAAAKRGLPGISP